MVVGTHRFGTKDALMYYNKFKPKKTTIVHWIDKNADRDVQLEEIEAINIS